MDDKLEIRATKGTVTPIVLAEIRQHKPEIIQALRLVDYQKKSRCSNSVAELYAVLEDFSQYKWHICQQSDMSAAYTNHALRLIQNEEADKWKMLENLACLCWGTAK